MEADQIILGPIVTEKRSAPDAQLFLNRSVLKSSPVFDHPLGEYLTEASIRK